MITGPPGSRPEVHSYQELAPQHGNRVWRETGTHGQTITYEVVESAPARRLVSRIADAKLPLFGTWTYELAASGEGCSLTITEHPEVYNPVYRFASRFIIGHNGNYRGLFEGIRKETRLMKRKSAYTPGMAETDRLLRKGQAVSPLA